MSEPPAEFRVLAPLGMLALVVASVLWAVTGQPDSRSAPLAAAPSGEAGGTSPGDAGAASGATGPRRPSLDNRFRFFEVTVRDSHHRKPLVRNAEVRVYSSPSAVRTEEPLVYRTDARGRCTFLAELGAVVVAVEGERAMSLAACTGGRQAERRFTAERLGWVTADEPLPVEVGLRPVATTVLELRDEKGAVARHGAFRIWPADDEEQRAWLDRIFLVDAEGRLAVSTRWLLLDRVVVRGERDGQLTKELLVDLRRGSLGDRVLGLADVYFAAGSVGGAANAGGLKVVARRCGHAVSYTGETAADGSYRVRLALPGTYSIEVHTPGMAQREPVLVSVSEAGEEARADVELLPQARIEGVVVEAGSGRPLSKTWVRATPRLEGDESCARAGTLLETETGPDGAFAFAGAHPGWEYTLTTERPRYAPATILGVCDGMAPLEVLLTALPERPPER